MLLLFPERLMDGLSEFRLSLLLFRFPEEIFLSAPPDGKAERLAGVADAFGRFLDACPPP